MKITRKVINFNKVNQTGGSGFVAFDIDAMKAKAAKKREDRSRAYNMMQQQNPGMAGFASVSQPQAGFASVSQPTSQPKVKPGVQRAPGLPDRFPLKEYLQGGKKLKKGDIIQRKDGHYYKVIDPYVQGPRFTTTKTEIEKKIIENFTLYKVGDNVKYTPCDTKVFKGPLGSSGILTNLTKGREYDGVITRVQPQGPRSIENYTVQLKDSPMPQSYANGYIPEATLECLKLDPNFPNPDRKRFYYLTKLKLEVGLTAPQIALAKFTSVNGTPTVENKFKHILIFEDNIYFVDSNHESMQKIKDYPVNLTPEQIKQNAKKLVDDSDAAYERMKKKMFEKIARENELLKKMGRLKKWN